MMFSTYFFSEKICGASFLFAFCYKSYGFPFHYIITGDVDIASGYIKTTFLGAYFIKIKNILFNPLSFVIDSIVNYIISCLVSLLFENKKFRMRK